MHTIFLALCLKGCAQIRNACSEKLPALPLYMAPEKKILSPFPWSKLIQEMKEEVTRLNCEIKKYEEQGECSKESKLKVLGS